MGETEFLSDVIKKKLTKIEHFLVKAKVDPDDWQFVKEKSTEYDFGQDVYMNPLHIMAFSDGGIPKDKEGYVEAKFNLAHMRKMLLYFNRNLSGSDDDSITVIVKKDNPIQFSNGKIWGSLAPRTEDDGNNYDDD